MSTVEVEQTETHFMDQHNGSLPRATLDVWGRYPPSNVSAELFQSAADWRANRHAGNDSNSGVSTLSRAVARDVEILNFLASLIQLAQCLRDESRRPTASEQAAFAAGYGFLDSGYRLPNAWLPLGTSGFRSIQTWLSLADPGSGHLNVTVTSNKLLHGTLVHLEQIDRGKQADREKVEPYRLAAARQAARVRLHVGVQSPVTALIGRPVFENRTASPFNPSAPIDRTTFETDLPKTVHLHAAACSWMFGNGVAECKIAIEHMSSSQAIYFMKVLLNKVVRDRERQYLSAAFNINTPLHVDHVRPERLSTEPKDIAMMGIEITHLAGFDKVAWDGSSNQVPSDPITTRLDFTNLLELAHTAHQFGLETYISGGMGPRDMRVASYAGIDGVGIGARMHYHNDEGIRGLNRQAILNAIRVRDRASRHPRSRAARLLARLDILASGDALVGDEEKLRLQLYQALLSKEMKASESLEKKLTRVRAMANNLSKHAVRSNRALAAEPSIQ